MRRGFWIGALLLLVVVAIGVGVGAYHAGFDAGLDEAAGTAGTEIVRVVGPGYGQGGGFFFPFGFFLFPLFFIGVFLLLRGAFWRRHEGGHWHGGGGPGWGGSPMFEDWHRRQHEGASGDHPGSGGEPSGA